MAIKIQHKANTDGIMASLVNQFETSGARNADVPEAVVIGGVSVSNDKKASWLQIKEMGRELANGKRKLNGDDTKETYMKKFFHCKVVHASPTNQGPVAKKARAEPSVPMIEEAGSDEEVTQSTALVPLTSTQLSQQLDNFKRSIENGIVARLGDMIADKAVDKYITDNGDEVKGGAINKYIEYTGENFLEAHRAEVLQAAVAEYRKEHESEVRDAAVTEYLKENESEVEEAAVAQCMAARSPHNPQGQQSDNEESQSDNEESQSEESESESAMPMVVQTFIQHSDDIPRVIQHSDDESE